MKTSWCFAGDTGVIPGMMHKIQHRLSQSWKWPLPSDDLKPAVRWEQDVELLPQQVGSRGLLLAILPTRCNLSAAALQPCVWPRRLQWAFAHISGTGSSHIHQTHNTFLQLFLTSLFRNAFNSAVLLPSTVRSRILLSLRELHFPLPISSSLAFADHHSWPQDLLPLLYLPPQCSLLKLPPMQIIFHNSSSLNHCLFLFKSISRGVTAENKITVALYVRIGVYTLSLSGPLLEETKAGKELSNHPHPYSFQSGPLVFAKIPWTQPCNFYNCKQVPQHMSMTSVRLRRKGPEIVGLGGL